MDTPNTPPSEVPVDQNHVLCEGKVYRRVMDPELFHEQYEQEIQKREDAKERRINALKGLAK